MTPAGFSGGAGAVLAELASAVPFPMWLVSRKSGDDYVVLAAHDRQYGLVQGDVLPWSATLCARVLDGDAPDATGDVAAVPALRDAAAELRMDIGSYITVPLRTASGDLLGTLCGGDPLRRPGPWTRSSRTSGTPPGCSPPCWSSSCCSTRRPGAATRGSRPPATTR
jgi:hypothetical protein